MMKKINGLRKALIVFIVLVCIVPCSVFALDTSISDIIDSESPEITVTIDSIHSISEEEIEQIKQEVLEYHLNGESKGNISTYGITCTLLGHDKETNIVRLVEHKVAKTEPRCKEFVYKTITCSRCDYKDITLINDYYISCCPEN